MNIRHCVILIISLLVFSDRLAATEKTITIPMKYGLMRNILSKQLYTGAESNARIWKDAKDCSFLDLSNPEIGNQESLIKIDNNVHARIGIQVAGNCMPMTEWRGFLQTYQQAIIDSGGNVLSFPVVRAKAFDKTGLELNIKQLQDLIKNSVELKLADIKIDLNHFRPEMIKAVLPYVEANHSEALYDLINSLRFKKTEFDNQALSVEIGFNDAPAAITPNSSSAAFTQREIQHWRTIWTKWQQNLENNLNRASSPIKSEADRSALRDLLKEAGAAFEKGLSEKDISENDPVRNFLETSWDKLAPLLGKAGEEITGAKGLGFLTLISASDLLAELDPLTKPIGLEFSANGLRKMMRSYFEYESSQQKRT
jgi:hypothetical protein